MPDELVPLRPPVVKDPLLEIVREITVALTTLSERVGALEKSVDAAAATSHECADHLKKAVQNELDRLAVEKKRVEQLALAEQRAMQQREQWVDRLAAGLRACFQHPAVIATASVMGTLLMQALAVYLGLPLPKP